MTSKKTLGQIALEALSPIAWGHEADWQHDVTDHMKEAWERAAAAVEDEVLRRLAEKTMPDKAAMDRLVEESKRKRRTDGK
jgi:hypothetical protein